MVKDAMEFVYTLDGRCDIGKSQFQLRGAPSGGLVDVGDHLCSLMCTALVPDV